MSITERHGELLRWRREDPEGFARWKEAQREAAERRPIGSSHIPVVSPEDFMGNWNPERDEDRRGADREALKRNELWINEHTQRIAVLESNYAWIKATLEEIQALIASTSERVVRVEEYIERGICPDIEEIKIANKEVSKRNFHADTTRKDRLLIGASIVVALGVGIGGWFF
jgi:hypothetical protein